MDLFPETRIFLLNFNEPHSLGLGKLVCFEKNICEYQNVKLN